jgi:hypothetical protein
MTSNVIGPMRLGSNVARRPEAQETLWVNERSEGKNRVHLASESHKLLILVSSRGCLLGQGCNR